MKILLVDDEPEIRLVVSAVLQKAGHDVDLATQGSEALTLLQADPERYNLLITDHNMPGVSGIELVEHVRTHDFKGKIIILSGAVDSELEDAYQALNVDFIIKKPFMLGHVTEAVDIVSGLGNQPSPPPGRSVNPGNLGIYLTDHHAGSVAALELLDYLVENSAGSVNETVFRGLRTEIKADQLTLEELMRDIGIHPNPVKKITAWFAEKAARIKLHSAHDATIGLFQALEALMLGILGKKSLWRALSATPISGRDLGHFNFAELERRAGDQADRVEIHRLAAAAEALG